MDGLIRFFERLLRDEDYRRFQRDVVDPGCAELLWGYVANEDEVSLVGCLREAPNGKSCGQLWVSPSTGSGQATNAMMPATSGSNFWVHGLPVDVGTQQIVAAVCDVAGNTTFVTSTVWMAAVTNAQYGFSLAGCLTSAVYRGAQYANSLALAWNGQYQLTAVETNGVAAESYAYDALGRRVRTVSGGTTAWHVYDGVHVLADVDEDGELVRSYVHGPGSTGSRRAGIDNLLAITVHTGATAVTYYALTDHLGTVHALADESGAIVESYRFDAWGRVLGVYNGNGTPLAASALGNRFLWQGREYSWKTGFYCFRARWYDPITGRWLSKDPIGISGGLNQFVFCGNNPVNFVDPYGLCQAGMFFRGLGGAVVSGVGAVVGAAAATTGVGSVPGGALALYSSYSFGANIGNMVNSFRDVQAAPTGPIAGATVLATDNRTARNIAEAADLAIPLALSIGTSPVAWSRLPTTPVGPAGSLAGTLQRVPGDPAAIYPWIRGFQIGHAGVTAYDAWRWTWDDDPNDPCK